MIDSINFVIRDVKYLEFKNLTQLGIYPKKFNNSKKNFESIGYAFKYKNIGFKYYKSFQTMLILANAHKILQKRDIHINDLQEYKDKVYKTVNAVLNTSNVKLELSRVDYCIDIELEAKQMNRYIFLLNMHKPNFKYMKMKNQYETSIHKSNNNGKTNLNIYSRWYYTGKEEDRNILRIEIQVKKAKLKAELLSYGIPKEIDEYWTKTSFYENTIELLKNFLYEGNYCSRDRAKEIIKTSKYTNCQKKRLIKFLLMVSRYGIDDVVNVKKKYCQQTVDKYIQMLNDICINPIAIPKIWTDVEEIENLLTFARRTAEEKYFK